MDFENIINEVNYYDFEEVYDDILWPLQHRAPKIYLRDVSNPFSMRQDLFVKRYRFGQESVLHIVSLIRHNLAKSDKRGLPIAPEIAVLLTLRYYATASFQAVVGPKTEFLDIVARWAGNTHDSRIFQTSAAFMKYTQGVLDGRLVGDSGYPALPFLLTPVRPIPEDPPRIRYNRAQVKTRNVVERTFGIWKRRFPCLSRGLGNKLVTVSNIIVACAVLHNIALILKDTIAFDSEDLTPRVDDDDNDDVVTLIPGANSGFILRDSIIQNYFQ